MSFKAAIGLGLIGLGSFLHAQTHADLGNLKDFPVVSRVWLGSLVGEVQVNPEYPLELSTPGSIRWKVEDGVQVKEDEVIAENNVKKLQILKEKLEQKVSKKANDLRDLEIKNAESRRTLKKQVDDMQDTLSQMTLTETEAKLLGGKFTERIRQERKIQEKELKRSIDKLESDYFDVALQTDRSNLDIEIRQAELDYEEQLRSAEILAPVSGKLAIDVREPIRKATAIARIIKEGTAEVILELADVRINQVKPAELEIELNGDDGKIYGGSYLRTLEQTTVQGDQKILVFDLMSKDQSLKVPKEAHGKRMVRIYRKLEKSGYSVAKQDLVFRFPKEIDSKGWAAFFEKRWPGTRVAYVAPREVIIHASNEN